MIDASWVAGEKINVNMGGSTPGVPHVMGPSSAYDEVKLKIPPELVGGRCLTVEYAKVWGCGGSTYEITEEYKEPKGAMCRRVLESYESLSATKQSEFYAVFRAVYELWKRARRERRNGGSR